MLKGGKVSNIVAFNNVQECAVGIVANKGNRISVKGYLRNIGQRDSYQGKPQLWAELSDSPIDNLIAVKARFTDDNSIKVVESTEPGTVVTITGFANVSKNGLRYVGSARIQAEFTGDQANPALDDWEKKEEDKNGSILRQVSLKCACYGADYETPGINILQRAEFFNKWLLGTPIDEIFSPDEVDRWD